MALNKLSNMVLKEAILVCVLTWLQTDDAETAENIRFTSSRQANQRLDEM